MPVGMEIDGNQKAEPFSLEFDCPTKRGTPNVTEGAAAAGKNIRGSMKLDYVEPKCGV